MIIGLRNLVYRVFTRSMQTQTLSLPQGQISGVKRQTIYDQEYYSFEGIPFAKPPLGELRFKAPVPAEPWEHVWDCTDCASKPMQFNLHSCAIEGSEDCLYLNVYTKRLTSQTPLPVMVYIYGGAFYLGGARRERIGPDYLMFADVILVTFNYRLCSLGFLSLPDPELEVPGNAGLKDQVLALKWVKQYITHFNGDANNITVFGESAGGACTHYMTATQQMRGLFQKAICMSGCILNEWANIDQTDHAYRLAKFHGYSGENNDKQVLNYLRNLEPCKLVDHNLFTNEDIRNGHMFIFAPTVEPYVSEDCVIPKPPLEMLKTAWGNNIPIMIGGTSFEGLVTYPLLKDSPESMTVVKCDPERLLPKEIRETHTATENRQFTSELIKIHFGDMTPSPEAILNFVDFASYRHFWVGIHRTVLSRLTYAKAPTYQYRFDFDSPDFNHHRKKMCGDDIKHGVAHGDDLDYLFHSGRAWKLNPETAEYKTIRRMVALWTAFAQHSDPNCANIMPIEWQPVDISAPHKALNISYELMFLDVPERKKVDVWKTFYKKENLY